MLALKTSEVSTKRHLFFNVLKDVFLGKVKNIEGLSATVKLMKAKSKYYQSVIKPALEKEIGKVIQRYPDFEEELYDKLYNFFSRYFTGSGAITFAKTPFHNNVYDRIYTNEKDVILFWKTRDLYYIKTEKVFKSMEFDYKDYHFVFDASRVEGKRGNEKRSVIFTLKGVEGRNIIFEVHYKEGNRETPVKNILKSLQNYKINLTEEDLIEIFKTYNKQAEIDFFIHKKPREFLREQFNLWLYQYLSTDHEWPVERLNQFNLLRKVAFKLIDMIAQFEEEILKIWLKPRFVLNSNYVISLDGIVKRGGWHIIEKLQKHPGWQEQVREWIELGILEKAPDNLIEENLFERRLKKEYQFLPVDTKHFKDLELEILELFDNLDDELDGWLIKSENFQALNTILRKYKNRVKVIYIDPPYNTGNDEFIYLDLYKQTSWITMLENRLQVAKEFLRDDGIIFVSIGNNQNYYCNSYELGVLMKDIFPKRIGDIIWQRRYASGSHKVNDFIEIHEYILCFGKEKAYLNKNILSPDVLQKDYKYEDEHGRFKWQSLVIHRNTREERPNLYYGVVYNFLEDRLIFDKEPEEVDPDREVVIYPSPDGKSVWAMTKKSLQEVYNRGVVKVIKVGNRYQIVAKKYLINQKGLIEGYPLKSIIEKNELPWDIGTTGDATEEVRNLFGIRIELNTIKPVNLIKTLFYVSTDNGDLVMDFFAGSGTTAEALLRLNKYDGKKRKFIVIEMSDLFYKVIIPRIKKVSYCIKWKDGKPVEVENGISIFVKYYELEQFEDIISNVDYSSSLCAFASLFETDYKLLKEKLDLDHKDDNLILSFDKLYDDIDIIETFSCHTGEKITKDLLKKYYTKGKLQLQVKEELHNVWRDFIWW